MFLNWIIISCDSDAAQARNGTYISVTNFSPNRIIGEKKINKFSITQMRLIEKKACENESEQSYAPKSSDGQMSCTQHKKENHSVQKKRDNNKGIKKTTTTRQIISSKKRSK